MAVNEEIVTGRKFRKLIDEVNKIWQRISFWTKASDVEFDDAKTAELKVGAIDGITDSLASTSSRIAASAKSVNQLSNDLGGCSLEQNGEDFYIVGADAVRKKLGSHGTIKCFEAPAISQIGIIPFTYDLSKVFENYKSITAGDIVGGIKSVSTKTTSALIRSGSASFGEITSYNPETGIISATVKTTSQSGNVNVTVIPCFYVID